MDKDQVKQTIQTWRETPAADLKQDDFEQFRNLGCSCLAEGESEKLLEFLQNENNQVMVRSMGSVLVSPLLNTVVKKDERHRHCQAAITHLTVTCSSEQVVNCCVQVVEEVDPGLISDTIIAVVLHLQTGLLRLEGNQAASWGAALSALHKQLTRLPVPYSKQKEDEDEYGLCRCCDTLAAFIKVLAEKTRHSENHRDQEELKKQLLQFCIKSLREPLLEAELTRDRESSLWLFATAIMVALRASGGSIPDILFYRNKTLLTSDSQSQESRASLAYLLFVQLITYDSFPSIFSPTFVLQSNMENISQLLSSKNESHLRKGLALFENGLDKVEDSSLPVSLLELQSFYSATQNLRFLLTDCPIQPVRESGLKILQMFIHKLDTAAKHKFFRCLLISSNHSGLEGFAVKNIKNQVDLSLSGDNNDDGILERDFLSLLRLVFHLPEGAKTDLLHNLDRIMESLNLLRFLLLRHKLTKAGEWTELWQIKDEYLKMLRVCISMSRSYYSSELKALTEDVKLKAREMRSFNGSLKCLKRMVKKHKQESNLSPAEQHQVLQSALVTFDLMESLIFRIEELTDEKLKIPN